MTRMHIAAALAVLMIGMGMSPVVFAQEARPWSMAFSLNYWYADWSQDNFDGTGSGMFGPKVTFQYDKFGVGLIYMQGAFDIDISGTDVTADTTRRDLDFLFQYRVLPFLGLNAGYKYFEYEIDADNYQLTDSFDGFGLGLSASHFFTDYSIGIYGSFSFLPWLNFESDIKGFPNESGDADGFNFEFGAGYYFENIPLGIDLGYRFQQIEKKDVDFKDTFKGPVLEVSWTI